MKVATDIKLLKNLKHKDSKGQEHVLHPTFYTHESPNSFCNADKMLDPAKVRRTFMMAAIISPSSDTVQDLLDTIKANIQFLNAYLITIDPKEYKFADTLKKSSKKKSTNSIKSTVK